MLKRYPLFLVLICLALSVAVTFAEEDLPAAPAPGALQAGEEDDPVMTRSETMLFLKQKFPEALKELAELKRDDPDEAEEAMEEYMELAWEYRDLKEEMPEVAEAMVNMERYRHQAWDMADDILEMKPGKREPEIQKLKKLCNSALDQELVLLQSDLHTLQMELKDIRYQINEIKNHRDKLLKEALKRLLEDDDEEEDDEEE